MIIVRIWGGLGNQLFQYAYAYSIARRSNNNIYIDTNFYNSDYLNENKRFTKQKFQLKELNLNMKYIEKVDEFENKKIMFLQRKNINRVIRIFPFFSIKIGKNLWYIKETRFRYMKKNKLLKRQKNKIYLDGYWQTPKYFNDYLDELRKQFIVDNQVIKSYINKYKINDINNVAIHIRRGDYKAANTKFSNLYLLDEKYYNNAIQFYKDKLENPRFFVFTNDFEWARKKLIGSIDFIFVNEDRSITDLNEFQILCRFNNYIIANSTFSWWPAYLSSKANKMVISPKRWFGNKDILPNDWIKI